MRISSKEDLDRLSKRKQPKEAAGGGLSDWAVRQIHSQLDASGGAPVSKPKHKTASRQRQVVGESPGEASLRLALLAEFGDFHQGGEVVQELIPFPERGFRADFALPRYRIYIEVLGWTLHGRHKDDHLSDCARALFFSARNWLPFHVSHAMATKSPGEVVDAIAAVLPCRVACPRDDVVLDARPHKHGVWYRLETPIKTED